MSLKMVSNVLTIALLKSEDCRGERGEISIVRKLITCKICWRHNAKSNGSLVNPKKHWASNTYSCHPASVEEIMYQLGSRCLQLFLDSSYLINI